MSLWNSTFTTSIGASEPWPTTTYTTTVHTTDKDPSSTVSPSVDTLIDRGSALLHGTTTLSSEIEDRMNKMKQDEEQYIKKLDEEISYEEVRKRCTHGKINYIRYNPRLYDPERSIKNSVVQKRLFEIFGSDRIPLQDPTASREYLRLYKNWLMQKDEDHTLKLITDGYNLEKKTRIKGKRSRNKSLKSSDLKKKKRKKKKGSGRGKDDLLKVTHTGICSTSDRELGIKFGLSHLTAEQLFEKAKSLVKMEQKDPLQKLIIVSRDEEGNITSRSPDEPEEKAPSPDEKATTPEAQTSSKKKKKKNQGFFERILRKLAPRMFRDSDSDSLFS